MSGAHRVLHLTTHPFPTRRSSDLPTDNPADSDYVFWTSVPWRRLHLADGRPESPMLQSIYLLEWRAPHDSPDSDTMHRPRRSNLRILFEGSGIQQERSDRKSTRLNSSH